MVELRGFEPLTFCMPCSTLSSEGVASSPVIAGQDPFSVRGRLARSVGIWGRWYWVRCWFTGLPGQGRAAGDRADIGRLAEDEPFSLWSERRMRAVAPILSVPRRTVMDCG